MKSFGDEIEYKKDGMIQTRAQDVVKDAVATLKEVEEAGLMAHIEAGKFAGVKRTKEGGKGLDGVTEKDEVYFNPFIPLMLGGDR